MAAPTSRLHGPSVSGSAAAAVSDPALPAPKAPANSAPVPMSARRSIRPLPAANSYGGDFPPALRRLVLMAILPGELGKLSSAAAGCPMARVRWHEDYSSAHGCTDIRKHPAVSVLQHR